MNRYLFLLLTGFMVIGCQPVVPTPSNQAQILEQEKMATQQLVATQSAGKTATQTILNQTNITETPTVSPTLEINNTNMNFRDDFNRSTFQPDWIWLNEQPTNWSLSDGSLHINVIGGYLNLSNASNVLLRPAPLGNYFAETSLLFDPDENNQFAGLVMYESDDNFIQAGVAYCAPINGCVGRGLYIDIYQDGKLLLPHIAVEDTWDELAIRIIHNNGNFSIHISTDGKVWYRIHEFTMDIEVKQVGIITGQNADDIPVPAIFEYFETGVLK